MLKIVMASGLILTTASVAVGYDFNRQLALEAKAPANVGEYFALLPTRVVSLTKTDSRKTTQRLPQVHRVTMATSRGGFSDIDDDMQIEDIINSSPIVKRTVAAQKAREEASWWAKVRQKFNPDEKTAGNRLADINARNRPRNVQAIDPGDLANMSAAELYANQAAIQQGLAATAARNAAMMSDIGLD